MERFVGDSVEFGDASVLETFGWFTLGIAVRELAVPTIQAVADYVQARGEGAISEFYTISMETRQRMEAEMMANYRFARVRLLAAVGAAVGSFATSVISPGAGMWEVVLGFSAAEFFEAYFDWREAHEFHGHDDDEVDLGFLDDGEEE